MLSVESNMSVSACQSGLHLAQRAVAIALAAEPLSSPCMWFTLFFLFFFSGFF